MARRGRRGRGGGWGQQPYIVKRSQVGEDDEVECLVDGQWYKMDDVPLGAVKAVKDFNRATRQSPRRRRWWRR